MATENIDNSKTIALYLPSIDMGGAERQVLELAKGLDKSRWKVLILTNSINSRLLAEVSNLSDVKIILIDKSNKLVYPLRLLRTLYREKPHIVCAYLLSAQIYSLLVRAFLPKTRFIFSIRDARDYSEFFGFKGIYYRWITEKSAFLIDFYIFNSFAGREKRKCLPDEKVKVIPNGIDTNRFSPNPSSVATLRREAGVGENCLVVGIVSNFSMYKGYDTFIKAAKNVATQMPGVHFIAIGNHDTPLGAQMRGLVNELGLNEVFHFFGSRNDVPQLLPGMDILCSSSVTEGFSNSICEGMSCGVPCIVTDVGDSAVIVGDAGIVVPPSAPDTLAASIIKLLQMPTKERRRLGESARTRIVELFGIPRMVTATEKVYEQLLSSDN